jgi:hypothetical protein
VTEAVGVDSAHGLFVSHAQEERRPMGSRDPPACFISESFKLENRSQSRTRLQGKELRPGGKMNSYREIAENKRIYQLRLAEAALGRYGLDVAGGYATLISDADCAVFRVRVPMSLTPIVHPYLGRIEGRQFLLRLEDTAERRIAKTYSELVLLAAMLRDTELALPEPVPALDGTLVPELYDDSNREVNPIQCVLFRWGEAPYPEGAFMRARHWQEN